MFLEVESDSILTNYEDAVRFLGRGKWSSSEGHLTLFVRTEEVPSDSVELLDE